MDTQTKIDLSRRDVYEPTPDGLNLPDEDVETCLKVLRSLCGYLTSPGPLRSLSGAGVLSNAQVVIHSLVKTTYEVQSASTTQDPSPADDDEREYDAADATHDPTDRGKPDPDQQV